MPKDALEYRGYRIIWDVRELTGTGLWRARAAVTVPPPVSPSEPIHSLDGFYFANSKQAMDYVIDEAKRWIDKMIETEGSFQP